MSEQRSESSEIQSTDLRLGSVYKDLYIAPDFQRKYVWDYEHVEKLLNNILNESYHEEGRLIQGYEYFLGGIGGCYAKPFI